MNKTVMTLGVLLVLFAAVISAAVYFSASIKQTPNTLNAAKQGSMKRYSSGGGGSDSPATTSAIEEELKELSSKLVADIHAEQRINLNMVGQLRAYRAMLGQIQSYADEVEKQLDIIEEIQKDEFQEDVQLQASLFSGKKPDLVASHLEEYRASRVGAILSKMKEREASKVLDIWAQKKDPRVGAFYREAMAAYLSNKRRDMHPELFKKAKKKAQDSTTAEK